MPACASRALRSSRLASRSSLATAASASRATSTAARPATTAPPRRGRAGAVKLRLATFSFSGRYRLCVKPTRRTRDLQELPAPHAAATSGVSEVTWYKNFPNLGTGIYTVTWHYGGVRLGPPLTFAVANS